ncbi:MAG: patatin-like phospholipase family protein [Desulfovermiculus sp.]
MEYPFQNFIFEGGGVKGIAYVGVFQELQKQGITVNMKRVGGTSAGAINAVLLALGYSLQETLDILMDLDFNNFMDDSWGLIRDTKRLFDEYGLYKGDFFKQWIGDRIREKTKNENSTFHELQNKGFLDLYLIGTNLSTGFAEVFSWEHTPRMRVVDAVRISMSIPLFFAAIRNMRADVYVDGGLLNNYPVKLFDRAKYIAAEKRIKHARETSYYDKNENRSKPVTSSPYVYNKETLGFRLDSRQEIAMFRDIAEAQHKPIHNIFDYFSALINAIFNVQENQHMHSDDWQRTVYINTLGVGTTEFNLPEETKKSLISAGRTATRKYLDWFTANKPTNHPDNRE